jgi:hypothetical protein
MSAAGKSSAKKVVIWPPTRTPEHIEPPGCSVTTDSPPSSPDSGLEDQRLAAANYVHSHSPTPLTRCRAAIALRHLATVHTTASAGSIGVLPPDRSASALPRSAEAGATTTPTGVGLDQCFSADSASRAEPLPGAVPSRIRRTPRTVSDSLATFRHRVVRPGCRR